MSPNVLIIDDDPLHLKAVRDLFFQQSINAEISNDPAQAVRQVADNPTQFKMVIADYRMPITGDKVVREIKKINPNIHTVVLSGDESEEAVSNCRKAGADQFYRKEKSLDNILLLAEVATQKLRPEPSSSADPWGRQAKIASVLDLVGCSTALAEVADKVRMFAKTEENVLISGPSGVGKESIAKAIHKNSTRKQSPFIAVNCGAIPAELIESELFGHTKGSFTGASSDKTGKFLAANKGTLFLDEVGEIAPDLQVKLLRALQEREIVPIGSNETIPLDIRIVAATNRDLKKEISQGQFRQDLYYRLNILPVFVPPLSERREDIRPIIEHIIMTKNRETGLHKEISVEAIRVLESHAWPGNVRELDGAIRKAYTLSEKMISSSAFSEIIDFDPAKLLDSINSPSHFPDYKQFLNNTIRKLEKQYLEKALVLSEGSRPKAARLTGLPYTTYLNKREKLGLDVKANI